jgi:hypothetical protein
MVGAAPVSIDRTEILREEIQRRLHDPSLIVVDALPASSYADGHIPGARNLLLADMPARVAEVLPDRTAEIAVYCGSVTCPTTLESALATLARLADEICGHCVPHTYAPARTVWMDRIR